MRKSWLLKLLLVYFFWQSSFEAFAIPAYTTNIINEQYYPLPIQTNNEIIGITGDGNIIVDTDLNFGSDPSTHAAINNSFFSIDGAFSNTSIIINTNSSSNGIIANGNTAGAINFTGSGASLFALTINSGTVSSAVTSNTDGTINLSGTSSTSPTINVGGSGYGTISNYGAGGNAIYSSGLNTTLTINNNATGAIISNGNALTLTDVNDSSSLILNNVGILSATSGYAAISLSGYGGTITNSGTIAGDIIGSDLTLSITNTGTINGNITLGDNADSAITLSGGTVNGNVLLNNENQNIIFNGGNLAGNINGSGIVRIAENTVLGGSIGNDSAVNLLDISDGKSLSFGSNSYSEAARKITLGVDSSFTLNYGQFSTYEVDGSSANSGTLNLNIEDNSTITISTPLGTTNGLATINIAGNLTDYSKSSSITIDGSIKATTTTISGIATNLNLAAGKTIDGNVVISDSSGLYLDNSSSVTGTIKGVAQYAGNLVIVNSSLDPYAVSSVTLNGNIGGDGKDLYAIFTQRNTTIDASTNNVAINALATYLTNGVSLKLGSGTFTGNIRSVGSIFGIPSNGVGNVEFMTNNTLGGNVGSSDGNSLDQITISSNATIAANNYQINAKNINLGAGATITTSSLISGGDNDDEGTTLSDAAILMGDNSSLTLNTDSALYATIDASVTGNGSAITINNSLNSTNSHINIGGSTAVQSLTLSDGAELDVTANNGAVKANAIFIGDGATLKLGNGKIVGSVDGTADGKGILNIQGNTTLDGAIGLAHHSLATLNVGTADEFGYTVNAQDSISATNVTVNGYLSYLSLADGKNLSGDVTLSTGAGLNIGDGSLISGTIKGAEQYQGSFILRTGSTFNATNNIGTDSKDLGSIVILGNLDLTIGGYYEAHSQQINLADGASFTIGSAIVEGNVKGLNLSNGIGQGDVSFVVANDNFSGTLGASNGHALNNLNILRGAAVDTKGANINSNRINITSESSLASSASLISGGNNGDDTGLINTTITLGAASLLTLDNVDTFLGTIDGSLTGEGAVILSGSYGNDSHPDSINIGGTHKIDILALSNSANLDVHLFDGIVKANTITLGNSAALILGSSDIVGTIDGSADSQGTVTVLGNSALAGEVGGTHKLSALNIGSTDYAVGVTANSSISATNINLAGSYTNLTLAANATISGDISLNSTTTLNLNDGSSIANLIHGSSQYDGSLNILEGSSVIAQNNIGAGGFDLYSVGIFNNSSFDLNTNDVSLNTLSVSLVDNSTLVVGSETVAATILGYNSSNLGSTAHGAGKGDIIFARNNTIGGNIGNSTGFAINSITINNSESVDAGSFALHTNSINVQGGGALETAGTISGGDDVTGSHQIASSILLANNATLKLSDGATAIATINGATDNKGILQILSGNLTAYENIGATHALATVSISDGASFNLDTNNISLTAQNISLDNNATLAIGTASVNGNILSTGNNNGSIAFNGTTNTLTGNIGGNHNNALANVMVNNANSVTSIGNNIYATTVVLGNYATLATTGEISGGADVNAMNAVTTAITLNANSLLILNGGSSVFGTIDGADDSQGSIEFTHDYATNGNIGSNFQLASIIVDDNINLNLATNSNRLTASSLYLGIDATLTIGSGSVNAAILSLNANSGSIYLNKSTNLNSGSTLGGDAGLAAVYIDNAAAGNIEITSNDSIKSALVRIDGSNSKLSLAENKSIIGNVVLATGATLELNNNSSVSGVIRGTSAEGSSGLLKIANGTVYSQSDIGGGGFALSSVLIASNSTLDLYNENTSNNSIAVNNTDGEINLESNSTLIIGSGTVNGTIKASSINGSGNVIFEKNFTTAGNVGISDGAALNNILVTNGANVAVGTHAIILTEVPYQLNALNIFLDDNTTLATDGSISGGYDVGASAEVETAIKLGTDSILKLGSNIVSGNSTVLGAIDGNAATMDGSGMGKLEITSGTFTTQLNIGSTNKLQEIILDNGAALNADTNSNTLNAAAISLGSTSTLTFGTDSIISAAVRGSSANSGTVNFLNSTTISSGNTFGGANGLSSIYIIQAEGAVIDSNDSIKANEIYINGTNSQLNLAASKSVAGNVTIGDESYLTLANNSAVNGAINGTNNNNGNLQISGSVVSQGNFGATHYLNNIILTNSSTLNLAENGNDIKATTITLGTGANLIIGDGALYGDIIGSANNTGTLTFATTTNYNSGAIGNSENYLANVFINSSVTITQDEAIYAVENTVNGNLIVNAGKLIDGTHITIQDSGILTLNDNTQINAGILGIDGGTLIINNDASFTSTNYVGGEDVNNLATIHLYSGATLDAATNNNDIHASSTILNTNSTLQIGSGGVYGNVIGNGSGSIVRFSQDNILRGSIGTAESNNAEIGTLTFDNLTMGVANYDASSYEIAANLITLGNNTILTSGGNISGGFNGTSTLAAAITLGNNSHLQLNDNSSVTANINGAASNKGEVDISGTVAGNINLGNGTKIATLAIASNSNLDISANDNSLNVSSTTLDTNAVLKIGTTTTAGTIDGTNNNYGTLEIASHKITTTNGDIGATKYLNAVNIASEATLNLSEHNNSLHAANITLGSASVLEVGSGSILGSFTGSTSGYGAIAFNANNTIDSSVALGTEEASLGVVTVSNGVSLTYNNAIYADRLNIGTSGAAASTLNMTLSSGTTLNSNIILESSAELNLSDGGYLYINNALDGANDNSGILRLDDSGILRLNSNIGSTHSLSEIHIGENYFLNAYTDGASISATNLYLANGAAILFGSGSFYGAVHGSGSDDYIGFIGGASHTLSGNLGAESDENGIYNINVQGTLNLDSYSLRANNFYLDPLDSVNAVLNFGSGNINIGNFFNRYSGLGSINFAANNNINFAITSENEIAALNIADGATITQNEAIYTTNTTIGSGTSGKLILAASKTLHSNVTINNGANLLLNNNSAVAGNILGASTLGTGTIEIASDAIVTAAGNLGTSDGKIATITLDSGANLNVGTHNITANSVSLGSGSILSINGGILNAAISASSNGYGAVIFAANNTLVKNIGSNSNKVSRVAINDDNTLSTGANKIYANNITLGNNATLELQDGSSISNQINGTNAGNGEINAAGTVAVGAIGTNSAVNNITTAANSVVTFTGDISAAGNVNINGNAIFSNATTNISADSFNVNSGSFLSLSINLTAPAASSLEVAGAAILSANTTLKLTISGSATSGTKITLINAGSGSEIATIDATKIDINNSGKNTNHGQTFSTEVSGNQLLLTLSGDYVSDRVKFDNSNSQDAYDAINNITDTTGELTLVQNYLNSNSYSIDQKEAAVKSVTPQVDNSNNRIAFNNSAVTANIISARLESLRNDIAPIDPSGPIIKTFNANNDFLNKSLAIQTLQPLRDNNFKPSYPSSIAIPSAIYNQPSNKAVWIQTFGSNINQNRTSNSDGFRANSSGISIGADYKANSKLIIGLTGGITQTNSKSTDHGKSTAIENYQLNIYSGYSAAAYFLNTTAGLSLNNYSSTRQIAIAAASAKADYQGQSYNIRAELGKNFKFKNEITFTPSLMLTAAHNNTNSYNETGAGTLNLHVKNNSGNFFEGRFGTELSYLFTTKAKTRIRPQISASYGYDFIGDQQKTTSNFIGQTASFSSDGAKVAQGSLKLGAGLGLYTTNDITFSVNYGFEHRTAYTSNSGWLRIKYGF